MERKAFSRAWRFLSYSPGAKWGALTAAVAIAVLYVALLAVLSLFTDLLVNRGKIFTYRNLSMVDREAAEAAMLRSPAADTEEEVHKLRLEERQGQLEDLGFTDKTAEKHAAELARTDFLNLKPREQELLWRAHIYRILRNRVNGAAAALVLPDFHELPDSLQDSFRKNWLALTAADRRERLEDVVADVGAPWAEEMVRAEATTRLRPEDLKLLWRVHSRYRLKEDPTDTAAAAYWDDRTRRIGMDAIADPSYAPELADRGILSLIVRTHDRTLAGLYNPVLGTMARLFPWMWKTDNPARPNYYDYLAGLLILAIALALVRAVAIFLMNYLAALATIEASTRLRRAVYHHTFRLGTLAFRALGPSEAVGIFTRQLEAVHDGLYTFLTVVYREPVKFGLLLAFALALNVPLALSFLLFAILVWLIGGQIAVYFRRQEREATQGSANQLALLQESLMLMRLVKCYLMELFNQARVERQLTQYADAQLRRYRGKAIYRPVLLFLGVVAGLVLLYVAGLIVLSGRLGVARAITLATALVSLYWPFLNWWDHRRFVRRAREAAVPLFKFLDRPGELGQVVGAEFLPPLGHQLEFDNVSLREPGSGRMLLQGVNLTIPAGQRVALVGPEEMEKHALVYLIPRFLDPTAGEIRIDQHNLRWVTLDSLRMQIAIVLQHNLVFNDTVANNIGCGDPSYGLPRIIEAAKIAHAHQFIQKLPQGYETAIGDLGHYLSVGEKFRVALARAILRDPALLIIEEPAAMMDDDTKSLLDDTFARVLPGRTVIFLPHRISTIRGCHRVFLLNKGQVEAAGEHREMLTQSELYRHLQYMEFNEFAGRGV